MQQNMPPACVGMNADYSACLSGLSSADSANILLLGTVNQGNVTMQNAYISLATGYAQDADAKLNDASADLTAFENSQ